MCSLLICICKQISIIFTKRDKTILCFILYVRLIPPHVLLTVQHHKTRTIRDFFSRLSYISCGHSLFVLARDRYRVSYGTQLQTYNVHSIKRTLLHVIGNTVCEKIQSRVNLTSPTLATSEFCTRIQHDIERFLVAPVSLHLTISYLSVVLCINILS